MEKRTDRVGRVNKVLNLIIGKPQIEPEVSEVGTRTRFHTSEVILVPINRVGINPAQVRRHIDEEKLRGLAESIKQSGVLQPILVKVVRLPETDYEVIAGERRLKAAKAAGLESIPAIVKDLGNHDMRVIALVENIQREDLNIPEKTLALGELAKEVGDVAAVASEVGLSQRSVERYVRLYKAIYGTHAVASLFEQQAEQIDFRIAEALARLWENMQGEARSKFIELCKSLGIRDAIKHVMAAAGGRPAAGKKDIYNIVTRKDHLVFTVRCQLGKELTQDDRHSIQKGLIKYLERLTGQTAERADEGRK